MQAILPRGWNSLIVTWWYFCFLPLSFPLGALHESPVFAGEAWFIGVIPSCCFFSCNSPLEGRRFKELFVLTISPVLPGGFSVSRTGQPKLFRSWNRAYIYFCKWQSKKRLNFCIRSNGHFQSESSRSCAEGTTKQNPKSLSNFKSQLLKFLGLDLRHLFLTHMFCYMMLC